MDDASKLGRLHRVRRKPVCDVVALVRVTRAGVSLRGRHLNGLPRILHVLVVYALVYRLSRCKSLVSP